MRYSNCSRCGDYLKASKVKTAFSSSAFATPSVKLCDNCQSHTKLRQSAWGSSAETKILAYALVLPLCYSVFIAAAAARSDSDALRYLFAQFLQLWHLFAIFSRVNRSRILLVRGHVTLDLILIMSFSAMLLTIFMMQFETPVVIPYLRLGSLQPTINAFIGLIPLIVFYGIRRNTVDARLALQLRMQLMFAALPTCLCLLYPIHIRSLPDFKMLIINFTVTLLSMIFAINFLSEKWPSTLNNECIIRVIEGDMGLTATSLQQMGPSCHIKLNHESQS